MSPPLADSSFAVTYDDLRRLDQSCSLEALHDNALMSLARFGIDKIIAAVITPNPSQQARIDVTALINNWPSDWVEHYLRREYFLIDPALIRRSGPHNAARWRDVFQGSRDRREQEIIGGAREHGLGDGVTFTIAAGRGAFATVSFAGENIECADCDLDAIALVAHFAATKAICLLDASAAQPSLTQRERDVLLWTCEGKTEWEIGAILGISEHSADKYVRSLKAKLAATSKTHMVAKAFRLGLVV